MRQSGRKIAQYTVVCAGDFLGPNHSILRIIREEQLNHTLNKQPPPADISFRLYLCNLQSRHPLANRGLKANPKAIHVDNQRRLKTLVLSFYVKDKLRRFQVLC